jgi:hypothetical protein
MGFAIVFYHGESPIGDVTDAKQRPRLPTDPPIRMRVSDLATARHLRAPVNFLPKLPLLFRHLREKT